MQQEKLSSYGFGFQTKLIACLMTDAGFTGQVYDLIKLEYFDSKSVQWLIEKSFDYFGKYKKLPTLEVFKVYVDSINDDLHKAEVVSTLRSVIKQTDASDLDFVKEKTIDFCFKQNLKNVFLESVPLIESGDYEAIKNKIDSAYKIGTSSDIGMDYIEDVAKRYAENTRNPVSTGWQVIDDITKGGLGAGELGIIMAPQGAGKSWLLQSIGAHNVRQGKTVVHYTLELSDIYTGIRYDCMLSGISLDKIALHQEAVAEAIGKLPGKLIIKWFPTKSISLMGIRSHLTKLKMGGVTPDIIIIDYIDLLKFDNKLLAKHDALELLYEEARGLSGEYGAPVWSVSQATREGLNSDIIESDKIAGAYAKGNVADVWMSLSRKMQDKLSNTARIYVNKNRFGVDGITFPVFMDTNRGVIDIHDQSSSKGKELKGSMKSDGEHNKNFLRDQFNKFNESKKATGSKKNLF